MKFLGALIVSIALLVTAFAGDVDLKGTGTITAQGKGIAKMRGAGDVRISGDGLLWVVDCSMKDDIQIQVQGKGKKIGNAPPYVYAYKGFNGTAKITGSRLKIALEGKDIKLEVTGKGRIHLKGHGTWQKGTEQGDWAGPSEGAVIDVGNTANMEIE